ncbi:putative holin-like toxin [Staphylococcus aureus]|nr:type I toxin-antitoxin system toxin PepG1 [Staphylococcus aureus]NDP67748.1 putative holin-like toxin [Staphylococcus aureus]
MDRWWLSEYKEVVPMMALLKSLERRRLMITISTMLQFGLFLIALIGLVIKLIELSTKNNHR